MVPWERRKAIDEDLIFQGEPGQLGQSKFAFDGDLLLRNPYALDYERRALGDAKQVLPVGSGFWGLSHGGEFRFLISTETIRRIINNVNTNYKYYLF